MIKHASGETPMGFGRIFPYPGDHVHSDITDLITSINTFGSVLVSEGVDFEGMSFKVSEELDEKLRDIPENQPTFDKLCECVPPFFLQQSVRIMRENEDGTVNYSPVFTVLCGKIDDEVKTIVTKKLANSK